MGWEKVYVESIIDALHPAGEVLEVGFDFGYAAAHIQTYYPKHHTIIESDTETAARAVKWADNNPAITIIKDKWKNVLPQLGIFDVLFFNDFQPEAEAQQNHTIEMGNVVVNQGRVLVENVKQQLPQLMKMRYSDADIEEFFHNVGQFDTQEMTIFLHELLKNEQISLEQFNNLLTKYNLEKKEAPIFKDVPRQRDCGLEFLEACLKSHMRKGSRFSCFASTPFSKFENPEFFDSVITNPNCDYQEKLIPVDVPKTCEYYRYNEALIMIVTKQS